MISDRSSNRRNVLRITGAGIGLLGGASSTAVASESTRNEPNPNEGITWKVVKETEQFSLVMVANEDETETKEERAYLFQVDKANRTVSLVDDAISTQELTDPSKTSIGVKSHEEWIEDWEVGIDTVGTCNGYVYDDHYVGGVAIESGESLNEHQSGLAAALGALVGGYVGGPWGGALGVLLGVAIDSAFFSHVDLSGRHLTLLMWDDHVGWFDEEAVRYGIFPGYFADANSSWAVYEEKISGPHIEAGEDILEYL